MNRLWLWALIVAILALGLLFRKGTDHAGASPASQAPSVRREGPVVTYSGSGEVEPAALTPSQASPIAPMAETAPDRLEPSMISFIRQNAGRKEIVFRDGSTLVVDDFTYRQLPEDVRFRLDYTREDK
jgi:hypothetical protein